MVKKVNRNTVKTNTVIESYNDIVECSSAMIDGKLYEKAGESLKTGLQDLIRVKQFWNRID